MTILIFVAGTMVRTPVIFWMMAMVCDTLLLSIAMLMGIIHA